MLQVVEIDAIEQLEAIRLRWTSLLYETPGASLFHSFDWLKVYRHHFRDGQRLRVLLAVRSETVIGILPLVVRKEMTSTGSVAVLTYPTIHPTHVCGPIGPNPTATLMACFRHLAGRPRDWDLLALAGSGEQDHGRTANALELAGFTTREDVSAMASQVCFAAGWTDYLSQLDISIAERLHDLDLRAHATGDIQFERLRPQGSCYEDDQPLEGVMKELNALNWHPSSQLDASFALLRDLATVASQQGMLDLNLLKWNGRLKAFSLNVQWDGILQQICVGQTAACCQFDFVSLLTLRMLQDSFVRNDRCIYFAESNGGVANRWAARQFPVVRYQHRAARRRWKRLTGFGRWLGSPLTRV